MVGRARVAGPIIPSAGLYPGILRPRPIYTPGYIRAYANSYLPRPNHTPMISITISVVLSDIPRLYPLRPEYVPHQGRINPCGSLCAIVLVDHRGPVTPRRQLSRGFDYADIFRQINFQDLAAEFAKKKPRNFHYFEIPSRPMQTDYAEILISCR